MHTDCCSGGTKTSTAQSAVFTGFSREARFRATTSTSRPEHVHLFVRGGPDFTLGRWVGLLKQTLARAANLQGANTRFWQEGFFDHVLRSDESYSQKWNYVRENPVRAGFVKSANEWPYQGEIVYIDRA